MRRYSPQTRRKYLQYTYLTEDLRQLIRNKKKIRHITKEDILAVHKHEEVLHLYSSGKCKLKLQPATTTHSPEWPKFKWLTTLSAAEYVNHLELYSTITWGNWQCHLQLNIHLWLSNSTPRCIHEGNEYKSLTKDIQEYS